MFNASDLGWIDFELRGLKVDLKAGGTFRYVADASTSAIVLAYAIGDGPVRIWDAGGAILDWNDAPEDLRAAYASGVTFAAWNAGFDSAVWNYATLGFPFLAPERVVDPMIQAGVSNLPTDLERASRALGGEGTRRGAARSRRSRPFSRGSSRTRRSEHGSGIGSLTKPASRGCQWSPSSWWRRSSERAGERCSIFSNSYLAKTTSCRVSLAS